MAKSPIWPVANIVNTTVQLKWMQIQAKQYKLPISRDEFPECPTLYDLKILEKGLILKFFNRNLNFR